MKTLVLYMPVLHAGYLKLFEEVYPSQVGLLTGGVIANLSTDLSYVGKKDKTRSIPPRIMKVVLAQLLQAEVFCANDEALKSMRGEEVILLDDDVGREVARTYFGESRTSFVKGPKLRYHRGNVEEGAIVKPDSRISLTKMDQEMFSLADKVSDSSPDWWRQVGGVLLTRCGTKVVGFNQHPDDEYVASFGDPRSLYTSGVRTDLSVAEHAERILIAEAARKKLGTEGSTMYLTTFPCLPCAEMIVRSGVSRLLYRDPSYGLLDAEGYLRQSGVELVAVG